MCKKNSCQKIELAYLTVVILKSIKKSVQNLREIRNCTTVLKNFFFKSLNPPQNKHNQWLKEIIKFSSA